MKKGYEKSKNEKDFLLKVTEIVKGMGNHL